MKYKRVSKEEVYNRIVSIGVNVMNPTDGTINLKNLASLLNTSRYQVKKYIDELRKEGLVELNMMYIPDEYELYPPYWGYRLTDKGRSTEYYKMKEEEENRLIEEVFGNYA